MIDVELIFEKEISLFNLSSEFIIEKVDYLFSISKTIKPKISKIIRDKKDVLRNNIKPIKIFGIIGILSGLGTDYLMVISKAALVGIFFKSKLCQISEISFIPFDESCENHLIRNKDNFQMINDFLKYNKLYFSTGYNLTTNIYENFIKPDLITNSYINQIKANLCWNYNFINSIEFEYEFTQSKDNFIFPIINGFIDIRLIGGYEKELTYILISRKDTRRSGVRFLKRGCDLNGNAANLTETEQILFFLDEDYYNILSYTQLRGSIPLIWKQPPEMQPVPRIYIDQDYIKQVNIFKKHINDLIMNYGDITLVNLINMKGDQKKIGEFYQNLSNEVKDEISHDFIWFDFNSECKNMKYENLNKLLKKEIIVKSFENFNFTHLQVPHFYEQNDNELIKVISQQTGVIRTNCVDSLDRTNVVQTLFARNILHQMLSRVKLNKNYFIVQDAFEPFNKYLEKTFRSIWADHGDTLSYSYAGTPAQKGDFTRYGYRTTLGVLVDIRTSATRYYLNNFKDGYRQDCNDYFLGLTNPFNFIKRNNIKFVRIFFISIPIFTFFLFFLMRNFVFKVDMNINENVSNINYHWNIKEKLFSVIFMFISLFITTKSLVFILESKMSDKPSRL